MAEQNEEKDYHFEPPTTYVERTPSPTKNRWMNSVDEEEFKILDPDDPLMKRFQDALKAHLLRMNEKLSAEIGDIENELKVAKKSREDEAFTLYGIQQEASKQEEAIENYKDMLAELITMRADVEERLKKIKASHKQVSQELEGKQLQEKKLLQSIESLDMLMKRFSDWESELSGNLVVSQRISEKDAVMEKELLYEKQKRDYILYRLEDEVWKLQNEIKDLDEQLQIKDEEKQTLSQTVADATADLEGLEREHRTLYSAWNTVLNLISQRDKIHGDICTEQREIRNSLHNLQMQIEKFKKDSGREMENNERLTSLQTRVSAEIKLLKQLYDEDKATYESLESNFIKISKNLEQADKELMAANSEHDTITQQETLLNKVLSKFEYKKRSIEEEILAQLDDKITQDKTIKFLNKQLHDIKDSNLENELNLMRSENTYGKLLLELEKYNSINENEKFDMDAAIQRNVEKERESDKYKNEIKNYEALKKERDRKIVLLNKKIDEVLTIAGREIENPLDDKINSMEKDIEDADTKIKKAQQIWLRQQGYMFSLSEQRDLQIQELGTIGKQIMLMEQNNSRIEMELEKQRKEETNISRAMTALQIKLENISLRLANQRELTNELQDKNNLAKNEYINSLKDAEMDIMRMQTDAKDLLKEKENLKDELKSAQQESLSWEKKVQLANEANKCYKEERSSGGDISTMKSEILKMEMRLSTLRKTQEKLVQDMEFCISRRENIVDVAMGREKRNPKNRHNQRIVLRKRLDDQKGRIKQLAKEAKQIDLKIRNSEFEFKKCLEFLNKGQQVIRKTEDIIPDIEKQIVEAELIKNHDLEMLVRKQRRVNMLQDLKNGRYKLNIKNEMALDEEWQNQQIVHSQLTHIMNQTLHDFPLLKNDIRKILFTLETS